MSESAPPPRRRHTTTACVRCRESKIKCDGAFPTCSSCKNRTKQCQYQATDDRRRLSHRMVIEILSERIDELYQFIRQHSLEPPVMGKGKYESLIKALSHVRLLNAISDKNGLSPTGARDPPVSNATSDDPPNRGPTTSAPPPAFDSQDDYSTRLFNFPSDSEMDFSLDGDGLSQAIRSSLEDQVQAQSFSPLLRWNWPGLDFATSHTDDLDVADPSTLAPNLAHIAANTTRPDTLTSPEDSPGNETSSTNILIKQLSDRIGSLRIGPGGRVSYYGPTSNFNLVDMWYPDNQHVHRTVRHDSLDHLKRLGMGKAVPQELEEHLINLYFAWQDPALHVVKRDTYEKAKAVYRDEQEDTPYYSEALRNALCSLGAAFEPRHHPTFITYPKSLADFFADRAKTLLEIELDSPSIATVQALVILSGHDIGCTRDGRGWLYSGMAMRLAFHLALHLDMTSYLTSKSISLEEANLRRDVFWAAYTVDHIWSLHLGRTFRLNMEAVTVGPPDANQSADAVGHWIHYVSPESLRQQKTPIPDHTVELHRQRVLLCEIMAPLGFALYANFKMPPRALHELNTSTVSKLLAWKANLPSVLHVDVDDNEATYLPHVLLLHMLYYQNIIYSHRPWMSGCDASSLPYLWENHNPEHARAMCIDAATSIAKILRMYETRYGLRKINIQAVGIACSAALLLIFAVVIGRHNGDDDSSSPTAAFTDTTSPAMHLGACFRALDEFGLAWESAKKTRVFLNLLQRRWEVEARKLRESNMTGRQGSNDVVPPTKRPRMNNGTAEDGEAEEAPRRPVQQARGAWPGPPGQLERDVLDAGPSVDFGWTFMDADASLSTATNT